MQDNANDVLRKSQALRLPGMLGRSSLFRDFYRMCFIFIFVLALQMVDCIGAVLNHRLLTAAFGIHDRFMHESRTIN